ncbi:uncharacterized protein LOC103524116 [Trichonephila clavipes]|nr:uncharacterized protein LOC103524116 [Trichonephila clavipes]
MEFHQWRYVPFPNKSFISLSNDSQLHLIWKKAETQFHPTNIKERNLIRVVPEFLCLVARSYPPKNTRHLKQMLLEEWHLLPQELLDNLVNRGQPKIEKHGKGSMRQKGLGTSDNCRELLGKIKGKIVFQWVPSHCGLWGNERADFLAKKGTGILQNFRRDLTLHSAKLEIKRIFRESFRLTASRVARDKPWSTLCKKSHGIPSSPRAAAVAKFRLLTGHDCLCAHLFRFNLVTSPICVLCDTGQDMTAAHLDECSALNDLNCIVKRYWRARCLMT